MATAITTPISPATAPTMTSTDLVEFINSDRKQRAAAAAAAFPSKEHPELLRKNFLAKVPEVLGVETSAKFSADLLDGYGRPQRGYRFPKREACLMAMSYSYDLQAKVFDRMTALESAAPATPVIDFMNPHSLRAALLGYTEQLIAMEATVKAQAPAVAAQKRLSSADGSLCVTNAAKHLKMRPKDLFAWLSANKWIYKRAGSGVWLGYQDRIQSGLIEHSTTTVERSDGTEKAVENMHITAKGIAKLAEEFCVEVAA